MGGFFFPFTHKMRKILYYLRENLEITTREARSTLAFLLTALLSIGVYIAVNFMTRSEYARYTVEKYAVPLAGENSSLKKKSAFKAEELPAEKVQKFRFDPNNASQEQLTALGIPLRTARTILNYRNKGGKFRYREDLQKIYSLKPETYAALESWIDLPPKTAAVENHPVKKDTLTVRKKAPMPPQELSFDINTADTTALKKLKGIGSVYASRIIRFRDALGGFHSLDQLDETYGIPPDALQSLKKTAVIGSPVKQIPINETDTFRHPYLKAYQVKTLLAYRRQHGKFSSPDDLAKIKVLDEETIQKIKPYFSF